MCKAVVPDILGQSYKTFCAEMEPVCTHVHRVNGYSVYLGDDEQGLGIDTSDGYRILWVNLMLLNCTLTNA